MRARSWILLFFLWAFTGPFEAADQTKSASEGMDLSAQLSQQDVTITVYPFLDEELTKKTFHKFLVESRITPVRVTIRNERTEPIRVMDGSIRLIDAFGTQYRFLSAAEIIHEAARGTSGQSRRPPIRTPVPIPPTPRRTVNKNKDLEFAIRSKELGDRLVPPHSEEQGFLFFRVNGGLNTWKGCRLYIPEIRGLKTGERLLFFELDLK